MTGTQAYRLEVTIGSCGRTIVVGTIVLGIYGLIATVAGLQALVTASGADRVSPFPTVLLDQFLAIAPWVPATPLISIQTRRAVQYHRPSAAIVFLAVLGVAVVAAVNLMQAALLTTFGSREGVAWLDQYAGGLLAWGHFGYLWYVLVALTAFIFTGRRLLMNEHGGRPRSSHPQAIEVGAGQARVILRPAEIDWIEARGDYVRIHAGGRGYLKLERMKALEALLDARQFARVHRSAIVNLQRVRAFRPIRRGDYRLTLESGQQLRLARSRREAVLARLRTGGR